MQSLSESYQQNLFKSVVCAFKYPHILSLLNAAVQTAVLQIKYNVLYLSKALEKKKVLKNWSHDEQFRFVLLAFSSSLSFLFTVYGQNEKM